MDVTGSKVIEGGCFCRKIRYAIDAGAYPSVNCHCTMCRRIHAAPFVTWLAVPVARFRVSSGEPARLVSSTNGTRHFCPACGSHLACSNTSHPGRIDVAVGTLDAPEAFRPTAEVFTETRLWAHPA